MSRFATIDLSSGFVWWVGNAETPEDACRQSDEESLSSPREFEHITLSEVRSGTDGYAVHEVPADFDVQDGRDQSEINATAAHPFTGYYRPMTE